VVRCCGWSLRVRRWRLGKRNGRSFGVCFGLLVHDAFGLHVEVPVDGGGIVSVLKPSASLQEDQKATGQRTRGQGGWKGLVYKAGQIKNIIVLREVVVARGEG